MMNEAQEKELTELNLNVLYNNIALWLARRDSREGFVKSKNQGRILNLLESFEPFDAYAYLLEAKELCDHLNKFYKTFKESIDKINGT